MPRPAPSRASVIVHGFQQFSRPANSSFKISIDDTFRPSAQGAQCLAAFAYADGSQSARGPKLVGQLFVGASICAVSLASFLVRQTITIHAVALARPVGSASIHRNRFKPVSFRFVAL